MVMSLEILIAVSFFIFGTLVGSFLNVVILRFNTGKGLTGRSQCQSCGRTLTASSLIPVLSYVWLRGSCKVCGSKISLQYPLVETLTGVLFLLVFFKAITVFETILALVVTGILVVITVYDFKHSIILDSFVYWFAGISFVALFINPETVSYVQPSLYALIAGPILALPIWFLWIISRGTWIGLGDAKLFLGVGWFLGLSGGVSAFALSFWVGAVVSGLLIFLSMVLRTRKLNLLAKDLTIKTEIPFAPFIILSFFIVYFFEFNLITLITP
ncbi:MAG: prepilin peptidase [Candidatus Paceibacterota bacterium]